MNSREYRIRMDCGGKFMINEKRYTLEECCATIATIFSEMNILDNLLNNVSTHRTSCFGKDYFKVVKIWNEVPPVNFEIKKLSTGDISVEAVIKILKEQKEKHERARNKPRN